MQIRAEVENFRLELVRYVHFTVPDRQFRWVDRVFGTILIPRFDAVSRTPKSGSVI